MTERAGGERLYLSVPTDWPELTEDEKVAWANEINERLLVKRASLVDATD